MINILPIFGLPEIEAGTDLAAMLIDQIKGLQAGDIIVIAQKIVSKAEGRFVDLASVKPSDTARTLADEVRKDPRLVELVLRESTEIVRKAPHVLIVRHRLGHVMANAGIDASNIGPSGQANVLLLPENPDKSAGRISDVCATHFGIRPAVVISDSFGRPWRMGTVNVAIGVANMPAVLDQRGQIDRDDRIMQVTLPALADSVAAAAGLAMGEGSESIPAVIVRGVNLGGAHQKSVPLLRPIEEDLFR